MSVEKYKSSASAKRPPAWSMAALLFAARSFAFRTFVRSLASRYATMRWLICRRSMPGFLARCANDFIRVIVARLGVDSLVSSAAATLAVMVLVTVTRALCGVACERTRALLDVWFRGVDHAAPPTYHESFPVYRGAA